jgi:hypothetical protein
VAGLPWQRRCQHRLPGGPGPSEGRPGPVRNHELLAPTGPPEEGETGEKQIKSTEERVINAVKEGVDSNTPGRMPPAILNSEQTKEVAEFVATVAGKG